MQFIEITHSMLRTITYFNSALVVSNLLVWVILAVALKPERAIPATTAIIALLAFCMFIIKNGFLEISSYIVCFLRTNLLTLYVYYFVRLHCMFAKKIDLLCMFTLSHGYIVCFCFY